MILLKSIGDYTVESLAALFEKRFKSRKSFYNYNYEYAVNIVKEMKNAGFKTGEDVVNLWMKHRGELSDLERLSSASYVANLDTCLRIEKIPIKRIRRHR